MQPPQPDVPAALSAELARAPWGASPALYLISILDGRCALEQIPVPGRAWQRLPLDRVIAEVAGLGAQVIAEAGRPLSSSYSGTAVRFEVPPRLPPGFPDGLTPSHAGPAPAGRRLILAAADDGTAWQAAQLRAERRPHAVCYPPGTQPQDHASALRALRALTARLFGPAGPALEA